MNYWRSQSRMEVDFLIGDRIAIEVKSKPRVTRRDLKGLRALSEEVTLQRRIVVSTEPRRRVEEGVEVFPVELFLQELWAGMIA